MKSKKAISPLIATVLLIGIVVTIALLVWLWYGNVVREQAEKTGLETQAKFICASEVKFSIKNVCWSKKDEEYFINFDVENKGSADIDDFKIRITGSTGAETLNLNEKIDKTISKQTSIEFNSTKTSTLNLKVEFLPIIKLKGHSEVCKEKLVEIKDIGEC